MSSRSVYETTVATAGPTQQVAVAAAATVAQEAINASGCNVGFNTATGSPTNYTTFASAVKAANIAKAASIFAAEQARQATIAVAKTVLRDTGDKAPT